MSEQTAIQTSEPSSALAPMGVKDLLTQVELIQNVMKSVMKDGQHYGKVPGCGDKPTLLKPGAEKLGFVFRLAPTFAVEERLLERGHREYRVTCKLQTIGGNVFVGDGVGVGSTMEAKYRFRTGPKKPTGRTVPKSYWDMRTSNPAAAQEFLGGKGFGVAKNDAGVWEIVEIGEKVEHDNPADYYNTVLKMSKKRAQVDAILTATAASDIFTQDLEDIVENRKVYDAEVTATPVTEKPAAPATNGHAPANGHAGNEAARDTAPAASSGPWKEFVVPFGKNKGTKLGALPGNSLGWYIKEYQPKGFGNRGPSPSDLAFRAALDAAQAEMRGHAVETAQKVTQQLEQTEAPGAYSTQEGSLESEDVPF